MQSHIGIFKPFAANAGLVILSETQEELFVWARFLGTAVEGDTVEVSIFTRQPENKKRREGKISRIISRTTQTLIGLLRRDRQRGGWSIFLLGTTRNIRFSATIAGKYTHLYDSNDVVIFRLKGDVYRPLAIVVERLGKESDPRMKETIILQGHRIPTAFPEEVEQEATRILTKPFREKRVDFRQDMIVTIDGEDAKDFDDAICIKRKEDGLFELQVHIADVAHYVTEWSELDKEARERGNSIYIPGKVIPMLPFALSDNVCSLRPNEDRPVLSAIMEIDKGGNLRSCKIVEGLIHSRHRLTYTQVGHYFDAFSKKKVPSGVSAFDEDSHLREMIETSFALREALRKKRLSEGKIEFRFPETKIVLDKNGEVEKVYKEMKNEAYNLIEEFMVSANEAVATQFFSKNIPFLYRTHDQPPEDNLTRIRQFLRLYGISFVYEKTVQPKNIAGLLTQIAGTPYELIVSRFLLQSMSRAEYESEAKGHFGLALGHYSHFTSPIRRYPDLQIHRIIKDFIHGNLSTQRKKHYAELLPKIASHTTKTERTAEQIEMEVEEMHTTQYLQKQVGKAFEAIVTGVQVFGIFFELSNGIDGFLHISELPEMLEFDEERMELKGKNTRWYIGKSLKARVEGRNKDNNKIRFSLIE